MSIRGGAMNRLRHIGMAVVISVLIIHFGCAPNQTVEVPAGSERACIQGTVRYRSPIDSAEVPYANTTINAWRHDTDQALVETKADQAGNYCVEVPLGEYTVDLRVWGLERFEAQNYVCQGTVDNVDLGNTPAQCGGDCINVDILAECRKRLERIK
jgi:hypothetical protein